MLLLLVGLFVAVQDPVQPSVPELLSRVAEEAEILQQNAPKALTRETLEQRALMPPSRFRPRIGKAATEPGKPRLQVREIVSEYSVGTLKDSTSHDLYEFRQVIAVDGCKVQTAESARHALSLGLKSPDDRVRKRMLEDFAKHGLVDLATEYALLLLSFSKRGQENMKFALAGEAQVGVDPAVILAWQQTSPAGGVLEFLGNQAARHAMRGKLLIRKPDGLPLRIQVWSEHAETGHNIRDEASVDYIQSSHGFLTPASVVHRHIIDGKLITENLYRYEPFKMFSADTEIKFTELTDMPPAPTPPVRK
jgi:hypothetical protein